jgi:aspartyl aminopeptidase
LKSIDTLKTYLNNSATSYHAVANAAAYLKDHNFIALEEHESWSLKPGQSYYVIRNGSALIAWIQGSKDQLTEYGFRMIGAHTDSPLFKLKNRSARYQDGFVKYTTAGYGAPIVSTWLDRELALAGRAYFEDGDDAILFQQSKPFGIIPNLAIHLNREMNSGFEYNAQTQLAFICNSETNTAEKSDLDPVKDYVQSLNPEKKLLSYEVFVYDPSDAVEVGGLLVSGRIDNLAMCHASLEAIAEQKPENAVPMICLFDNEEIGSRTRQGADSNFLEAVLKRISEGDEQFYKTAARSWMLSADGAQAIHPNFKEKFDEHYAPIVNRGPVLKQNTNLKYATDLKGAASIRSLCEKLDIDLQFQMNRSDIPSGSTIGTILSARYGIQTVDVGNPMLAMHSIRETGGIKDHLDMIKLMKGFLVS